MLASLREVGGERGQQRCLTTAVVVGVAGFLIMLVSLDTFWTNACRIREARLDDLARSGRADGLANDHLRDRFRHDP